MTVSEAKRRRLKAKGWKVGTTREFLRLSTEEAAYIDLKVRLTMGLRDWRRRRDLTQSDLAKRLQSSQSQIAKIEAGDPSVSLHLLVRSLLTLGASHCDLTRIMSAWSQPPDGPADGDRMQVSRHLERGRSRLPPPRSSNQDGRAH
jgi:DNA-binding XRE family transcriptional regulator